MLGNVPAKSVDAEANELAAAYLGQFDRTGVHSEELAGKLLELATSDDPLAASSGTDAIFRRIVEPWGDRFEKRLCDSYVQFFAQAIDFCRRLPGRHALDQELSAFGMTGRDRFLQRAGSLERARPFSADELSKAEKVLVLSRVTLGADVAVTSVLINKLKRACPRAEIRLLGGEKAAAFFASDTRVGHAPFDYGRSATLIGRLGLWPELVRTIEKELGGLRAEQYLVADPDSRLTQLGLLPVIHDESRYCFFPSRSYEQAGAAALGDLTSRWADEVWGADGVWGSDGRHSYPELNLPKEDRERGVALRKRVRGRLATVNLGVGGNAAKRVADPFELDLLQALRNADYTVVLDRGAGDEEIDRTGRLIDALEQAGNTVQAVGGEDVSAEVLTWQGSLSAFAGLIAASDLYVGYDSAGGHLAAALAVPAIDVFSGAASPRMIERWRPWGLRPADLVTVDEQASPAAVISQVRERLR